MGFSRRISRHLCTTVLLLVLVGTLVVTAPRLVYRRGSPFCHAQGSASLGLFLGARLEALQLLELSGTSGPAAWPAANPVLCASALRSYDKLDAPRLWPTRTGLLVFFEVAACAARRRAVALADSRDGGATWRVLGVVLTSTEVDDLRRPYLFEHEDAVFLVTDSAAGPQLHRASHFPLGWQQLNGTMVDAPLRGASVVEAPPGRWLLTGSVPAQSRRSGGDGSERDALAAFTAASPLGPWQAHPGSPFAAAAASPGGGLSRHAGGLVRLGRSCTARGGCGNVQALSFELSEDGKLVERPLALPLGAQPWAQREAWDSAGQHYASLAELPSGQVVALVAGRSHGYRRPAAALLLNLVVLSLEAVAVCAVALVAAQAAARRQRTWRVLGRLERGGSGYFGGGRRGGGGGRSPCLPLSLNSLGDGDDVQQGKSSPRSGATLSNRRAGSIAANLAGHFAAVGDAAAGQDAASPPQHAASKPQRSPVQRPWVVPAVARWVLQLGELSRWRVLMTLAMAALALGAAAAGRSARSVAAPYWRPATRVLVGGQYSRFTLMVMSYESRLATLKWYVGHYSQCPSVGEILVVWNQGTPPDPAAAFPGAGVPVRVRVEAVNSMNNRFRPDPNITYRGVLSMDDDILMPCADVEAAFATWREDPGRLTGFYPRLADREAGTTVLVPRRYNGEPKTIAKGRYNLILAGAAFIDAATAFAAYSAPALAPARKLVDELRNCDDLLMNFVAANLTLTAHAAARLQSDGGSAATPQTVQYVRPSRRIDVSGFSGVGISHDATHFLQDANLCLAEFPKMFGGSPLVEEVFDWSEGRPPRCGAHDVLQCSYLS